MRRMSLRQAIFTTIIITLLLGPSACAAPTEIPPTVTVTAPPPTATFTPSPIPPTATPTPLGCLTQPGRLETGVVNSTDPPQEYTIYLPPCYDQLTDQRYPVLYLLHGQTYTMDQWIRLGVPQTVDEMFFSGESVPFIVVFPNDDLWNLIAGTRFGERLINALIPHIDAAYRTLPDRDHRALGGLSRGGGWTAEVGFGNPQLFGSLGMHSPAVFNGEGIRVAKVLRAIPQENRPRLWVDVGDRDRELKSILEFAAELELADYPHEYHFYVGDHSELYWSAHVQEYLTWYAAPWNPEVQE